MRGLIAAVGMLAVLAAPARASEPLRIEVRVAEQAPCPGRHAIATIVAQDTARVPALVDAAPDVTIAIAEDGDELRGELEVASGGRRVLRAPRERCADLVDALTFALRMILEIAATAEPASARGAAPAPATPIAALVPEAAAPVAAGAIAGRAAPARERYFAAFGLHGVIGAGPGPAPGVIAGAGIERGRWSVALEGRFVAPSDTDTLAGGPVSATTWLVSIVPCAAWRGLRGCAIAGAGRLHGKGRVRDSTPFATAGARLEAGRTWWGVEVVGHVDALAPLTPTTLRVGGEPVWDTAPVALSAGAGARIRFR